MNDLSPEEQAALAILQQMQMNSGTPPSMTGVNADTAPPAVQAMQQRMEGVASNFVDKEVQHRAGEKMAKEGPRGGRTRAYEQDAPVSPAGRELPSAANEIIEKLAGDLAETLRSNVGTLLDALIDRKNETEEDVKDPNK